jgi:hypothetical protein
VVIVAMKLKKNINFALNVEASFRGKAHNKVVNADKKQLAVTLRFTF